MPHALATTVKHGIGTRVTIAHAAQLAYHTSVVGQSEGWGAARGETTTVDATAQCEFTVNTGNSLRFYKYTFKILNGKTLLASRFKGAQLIH